MQSQKHRQMLKYRQRLVYDLENSVSFSSKTYIVMEKASYIQQIRYTCFKTKDREIIIRTSGMRRVFVAIEERESFVMR